MQGPAASLLQPLFAAAALCCFVSASSAAEIRGENLRISTPERQVSVTLFQAPGTAPRPAVLMLHGGGGFGRRLADYNRYAGRLAEEGFDTYLVYYYSAGDEAAMQRGASVFERRFPAWVRLVGEVGKFAAARPNASGKVGLVGFSNGGILAAGAGALDPGIGAAVVYYGAIPFALGAGIQRFPAMLVLHGGADTVIPVRAGQELAALARRLGGEVDIIVYPGEQHGFGAGEGMAAEDAFGRTLIFLKKELAPDPQ